MTKENPTPQQPAPGDPASEQADYTVELAVQFTVPAAFALDEVDRLAESLIGYVAPAESYVYDDYGPNATMSNVYVSAVSARSRVVGHQRGHTIDVEWGHGERCECHHATVDHECPEDIDGPPGRCFVKGCGCGWYVAFSGEAGR